MKKQFLTVVTVIAALGSFAQSPITPSQITTTGNNLIDPSNPRSADIVIGSDGNGGTRHDGSLMWWSSGSAARISLLNDVFKFSVWAASTPNVSLNSSVGGDNYLLGRVGVGTATPQAALDVNGYIQISGQNLSSPPPDLSYGLFPYGGVGLGIFSAATLPSQGIGICTNPSGVKTGVMRISSTGAVGIGTTSPDAKLAVTGTIHACEVKVEINTYP